MIVTQHRAKAVERRNKIASGEAGARDVARSIDVRRILRHHLLRRRERVRAIPSSVEEVKREQLGGQKVRIRFECNAQRHLGARIVADGVRRHRVRKRVGRLGAGRSARRNLQIAGDPAGQLLNPAGGIKQRRSGPLLHDLSVGHGDDLR